MGQHLPTVLAGKNFLHALNSQLGTAQGPSGHILLCHGRRRSRNVTAGQAKLQGDSVSTPAPCPAGQGAVFSEGRVEIFLAEL